MWINGKGDTKVETQPTDIRDYYMMYLLWHVSYCLGPYVTCCDFRYMSLTHQPLNSSYIDIALFTRMLD